MSDSFSQLRTAGGSNKPWVIGGVLALVVSLIGIALAAAYWSAQPKPEPNGVPTVVTVTAFPEAPQVRDDAPSGTFQGTLQSHSPDAAVAAWPAVFSLHEGQGVVSYPLSGCVALIAHDGSASALTKQCPPTTDDGLWNFSSPEPGIVEAQFFERRGDSSPTVEGSLSLLVE